MQKLKFYVISHTHWDREWYQTFQNYRYRLVRMMDNLIEGLEKDEEYKVFHLDGQTIVLNDYLEIRPENRERLTKLIQEGRIVIGPWYVMPDEFLISGEALIKNLQMGHKICAQYGVEPMKNGYVTDIFGHNSQFPQILNGFEIHSATLYRGIGDYEKDAFLWKSPDGSAVTTAKLEAERSYSNFYFAVRWPFEGREFDEKEVVEKMRALADRARQMAATDAVLMMDGVDHCGMEPELPGLLELFAREIPDVEFIHGNIEEYFRAVEESCLETIEGPLYHVADRGLNNQVLKNVLSSMVHLKQANDKCETYLTAVSEPLNAFCEMNQGRLKSYLRDDYSMAPRRNYLDKAWEFLIQNHPHDSICGCSLTDVHRDNEYRFRQAGQMAEISARDCVNVIARNIRCEGDHQEAVLLYNPSQKPVKGTQVFELPVTRCDWANRRFYDSKNQPMDVQVLSEEDETQPNHRLLQLIQFDALSRLTVAADIEIPAFGYTVIYCDNLQSVFKPEEKAYGYDVYYPPYRLQGGQMNGHHRLDNGKLLVELNDRGLLDVTVKESGRVLKNLHLFENRSDIAEGWNWRPAAYDTIIFGDNCLTQFGVLSDGPYCTVWKLTYELKLPVRAAADFKRRSSEEAVQTVTTFVTVPKDSETIYFKTTLTNHTEHNRLRVLFPTESREDCFYTKTPFDFQKWDVAHEDNTSRQELDTLVHPSQGVTRIGEDSEATALYSKGLYEVEAVENEERALALTLFRAAAGETGTAHPEDIKMQRELTFEYALSVKEQSRTQTLLEGEQYRAGIKDFRFRQNPQAATLSSAVSFLTVSDCEKVVSHISGEDGSYTLRLYDVSGKGERVTVSLPCDIAKAEYVNLKGEPIACGGTSSTENAAACGGTSSMENAASDTGIMVNGKEAAFFCPAHKIVTVRLELERM